MDQFYWNKFLELLSEVTLPNCAGRPEEVLAEKVDNAFQTDRGVAVVELKQNIPHCIFWPDYSDFLIKPFNDHYCYTAPYIYNSEQHIIYPVRWSDYEETEYNRDFNIPLDIGYTIGFGVNDPEEKKEIVFCIHKSITGGCFTDSDLKLIVLIRPLIQNLYILFKQLHSAAMNKIMPREVSPGCTPLSHREREIMELLTGRETMKEIALILGISQRTVETHAFHIYQKLCVASRHDLQRFVICPSV